MLLRVRCTNFWSSSDILCCVLLGLPQCFGTCCAQCLLAQQANVAESGE